MYIQEYSTKCVIIQPKTFKSLNTQPHNTIQPSPVTCTYTNHIMSCITIHTT